MKLTIVRPKEGHKAYEIASEVFSELAERVAGAESVTVTEEEYLQKEDCPLTVLIGSDAVNRVTAELYLSRKTSGFGIRYGTDDYCIRTMETEGERYLILAGG